MGKAFVSEKLGKLRNVHCHEEIDLTTERESTKESVPRVGAVRKEERPFKGKQRNSKENNVTSKLLQTKLPSTRFLSFTELHFRNRITQFPQTHTYTSTERERERERERDRCTCRSHREHAALVRRYTFGSVVENNLAAVNSMQSLYGGAFVDLPTFEFPTGPRRFDGNFRKRTRNCDRNL